MLFTGSSVSFPKRMQVQRLKPGVDIILDILQAVVAAQPHSAFARSLLLQYQERGGLSKKQLEGLYGKAQKVKDISAAKMATLQAIILKKPTRYKSELPEQAPLYQKDEETGQLIKDILLKFPEHKRVLFFRSKYENNEVLTAAEKAELHRFSKLPLKK